MNCFITETERSRLLSKNINLVRRGRERERKREREEVMVERGLEGEKEIDLEQGCKTLHFHLCSKQLQNFQ